MAVGLIVAVDVVRAVNIALTEAIESNWVVTSRKGRKGR